MALFLDNVLFTPAANGTADFVVSAAVVGFRTPATAAAANATIYAYCAKSPDLTQWEIGLGTYTVSTTTLARTTVLSSSAAANAKVAFTNIPQVGFVQVAVDITNASIFTTGTLGVGVGVGNTVANTTALHANAIACGTTIGTAGTIRAAGDITGGLSDLRGKSSIQEIKNALDKLLTIRTATYRISDLAIEHGYPDAGRRKAGMFTQDWEKVLPEAVSDAPFDGGENGLSKSGLDFKTLDYGQTIALVVEAVKELAAKVEKLQNGNNTIQG